MKTKIYNLFYFRRTFALMALLALIGLSMVSPLNAQQLSQGYGSDAQLQKGMIVRLKQDDATKVEAVKSEDMERMFGVVINANDTPITLSSEDQKVFVATVGRFDVLVSDQNGEIKAGDYVTVSAISGVGMKARSEEPAVIGRAIGDFNGREGVISTNEVKRGSENVKVNLGRVKVDIGVGKNPQLKIDEANVPEALKRATVAIAGKEVSAARAYASVVVFIVSAMVAVTIMYAGVRSGVYSVGRNPLSRKSIMRSMMQAVIIGLIIFISGLFGVYLLLRI